MIVEAIYKVIKGEDLDYEAAKAVMGEMMDGTATHGQMGAFLTALRMKGESIDEITGSAMAMREKAISLNQEVHDVMDIVGTGGDEVGTFNISTTTAFVVAAGGVPVAKHGNRSVSSKSGAADVLEKLGINIAITAEHSRKILMEINLCFMFAQTYHSSMKHCAPVRRELGVRTIFNILGPLANPAGANMQLMGVYDENLVEPLAQVLSNLGVKRGMVVHGCDGLDEATLTTRTKVCEIEEGVLKSYYLDPEELGLKRCTLAELIGGDAEENAKITRSILNGTEQGAKRDVVVLNAALCLYLAGKAATIESAIPLALDLITSGLASKKLEDFARLSNEVGV
ncbi:anthranilate phosphoribosyltransferase [Desulfosporosinus fructosivorans]|uniref:Anthranilate phosphoribosyltransferase n=1 Tax=Desulfosporosinus fructosivorans TaxID=2018669 RepID=A0A4Z0R9K9_9FIRM|nr:anthranilate phosphoribosyltransferase [Desulfosporosinus fructosivorans]TGE39508.1 anthranilate phosphoribosyltransferase [Desulfosporosinus fructosivorans]